MAAFVLDASVALAALLPEEPASSIARELLARVADEGAVVPALWPLEIANIIVTRLRRGTLAAERAFDAAARARALNIEVDGQTGERALSATFRLAHAHRLTAYDASYLELAIRCRLPLMSFDAALRRAGTQEAVSVLPA